MKKIIALVLTLACMLTNFSFVATVNAQTASTAIYVSVDGNNSNAGTVDSPLATIEGARDKIREIKKATGLPAGGITVYVKNGTYKVDNQINFTEEDSGTKEAPIVYKAWGDGKTSLLGGLVLDGEDFELISSNDTNYARLQTDSAKKNVRVYDLSKDLTKAEYSGKFVSDGKEYDPWSVGGRGGLGTGIPGIEVYYNDKAMDAARWPNRDSNGKSVYKQFSSLVSEAEGNGVNYKGPVYEVGMISANDQYSRFEKYKTTKYGSIVNITAYWSERSSFTVSSSFLKKQISIDHAGEQKYHWMDNTTYYIEHIFEELDNVGEYYVDYDTGKLYVYGDENINDAEIKVATFGQKADEAILRIDKASNISFVGFDIGLSRVNGIHVTSGTDVTITNCNIYGVGLAGIADGTLYGPYSSPYLRGRGYGIYNYDCGKEVYQEAAGYNHNYINNHVYNTGIHGIVIRGGDRIDLDPANHNVINCEINNTGRFEQSFGVGVEALGVGINIISNTIHDIPFNAIRFGNNDSVIEYNDIYNCMNEGSDMGVLYGTGWDASNCAGLEIRYNYIHDTDDTITASGQVVEGENVDLSERVARRIGIYSDDCKPFLEMHHNIFENMPIGITSHGGAEHNINDNIFINVRKPMWFEGYAETIKSAYDEGGLEGLWDGFCGAEYKALDNSAWRAKHPEVFEVREELEQRAETAHWGGYDCKGNYSIFYQNSDDCNDTLTLYGSGLDYVRLENNTFTTSVDGFSDIANGDYSFAENSAVFETHPNLKSIDINKIGRNKNIEFVIPDDLVSTSKTMTISDSSITTKAIRLVFNEDITSFSANLFDAKNNETVVTSSISGKAVTIKADASMSLDSNYYLLYTAESSSGTLEGCRKITFNKIWADDFEGYSDISGLSENYTTFGSGVNGFEGFEFLKRDNNTYLKITNKEIYLKPKKCGYTATYEFDILAEDSTSQSPKRPNFMIRTVPSDWGSLKRCWIQVNDWIDYQGIFAQSRSTVHGETFAFIRETSGVQNSSLYTAAFCNGKFLGENYKQSDDWAHGYNTFAICRWYDSNLLIDNMKIYTASEEDIVTTFELKNISATKSEITLDYSTDVNNGTFSLTQGGKTVEASVSKTNNGKTIVITPKESFTLDKVYVLHASGVSDKYGRTINGYYQAFKLETLFADDFSYENVSDMDNIWNVSYKDLAAVYTVSGFNETAGKTVYGLEDGWLFINGNYKNGTINIKADDNTKWNNYTLELDVKRDSGARYALDIMYHMHRQNNKPADYSNNFRLGIWGEAMAEACFTTAEVKTSTGYSVFTNTSHHLKLTTKTGKDLQVFSDSKNVLSKTYSNALGTGEIGFKAIWDGYKTYIDNVVAYKLVTLSEIPVAPKLEKISATKTELVLDYSADVTNGAFSVMKNGAAVEASVTMENDGMSVVITPKESFALDTLYEIYATNIPDNAGGTIPPYNKSFMLKTLFADDFSYENVSDMDSVWNVSHKALNTVYTVSGYNEHTGQNSFDLKDGWLVLNGKYGNENATLNIKSYDVSEWKNYTLELDVKRDSGTQYALDILYHMIRDNEKPNDDVNNFRLGIWTTMTDAFFTPSAVKTSIGDVFTGSSHHLKFTTRTGKDIQVFKEGTNILSKTYSRALTDAAGGEIGFKAIFKGKTQYIDNIVAYKLVTVSEIPVVPELENISATKSEVTLDYSAEVSNGTFSLIQGGKHIAVSVSTINDGKTVVITPENPLTLDTAYEIQASNIPNYAGGTIPAYNKSFMLKTLFADDFSYEDVSDMDSVWNVSYRKFDTEYTVSGYNEYTNKAVYILEDGWLAINGKNNNATINIKSADVSEWKNYTLELDVKRDSGTRYYLDIMYHMMRENGKPYDKSNNFRLGLYEDGRAEAYFTTNEVKTKIEKVFTNDSHHLKFTTKTGKDLQVFKDGTNVLSQEYDKSLGNGEIGFKVLGDDDKQYIDNVVVYKLVELNNSQNYMGVKEAKVTSTGVTGTYTLAKNDTAAIESADVVVAAYGELNKLLGMQIIPLEDVKSHEADFSFNCNTPGDIAEIKAFLWDKIDSMTPKAVPGALTLSDD